MFWLLQSTYPWSDLGIYESHRFWSSSSQLKVQVNSRVKIDSFPLVKWQRHSNTYYSFNCLTPKSLTTKYRQSMVWTCTISGEPLSLRDFFSSIIAARWQLMSLSQGANKPWPETVPRIAQLLLQCFRTDLTTQNRTGQPALQSTNSKHYWHFKVYCT